MNTSEISLTLHPGVPGSNPFYAFRRLHNFDQCRLSNGGLINDKIGLGEVFLEQEEHPFYINYIIF